ncbi:hypothetical protein F4703DRAFT_1798541 [Phycomyces blakesleeanus]
MGKKQLKYKCSTSYNLQQHVQTHDIAISSDSLTENAPSLNVRSIPNSEREFNVVKYNQEALFPADILIMIEEEQEEAMGENISSLRERIFNMTSLKINSNKESDISTLAFEDCQSLLDCSAASVLQAFVDGNDSMISVSMLTKVMYTINLLFELKKRADKTKADFKLPKHNKFNKVPLFPTTIKKVTIKATSNLGSGITGQVKTIDCHFNLPLNHLRVLLANTQKASYLSALLDYTKNQCLSVQQEEK